MARGTLKITRKIKKELELCPFCLSYPNIYGGKCNGEDNVEYNAFCPLCHRISASAEGENYYKAKKNIIRNWNKEAYRMAEEQAKSEE